MLVLSRQKNETIMIGDDVEITIVDIKGDNVRIGISAPRSIPVHRKEVYLAIQQENLAAAQVDATSLGALAGLGLPGAPEPPPPPAPEPGTPALAPAPAARAPRKRKEKKPNA